jgi:hypothetical protein
MAIKSISLVETFLVISEYSVNMLIHGVAKISVSLKYFLVLTGMFRSQPANQVAERNHSVESCALDMEDLVSKTICKFSK